MGKRKPEPAEKPDKPAPTAPEAAAIEAAKAAHGARPVRAQFEVTVGKGAATFEAPHSDEQGAVYLVKNAFATSSEDFVSAGLLQVLNATGKYQGGADNQAANAGLALIGAIDPQNELEAALAIQMVATHELSLMMLTRARQATGLEHMKEYGNLATKLSRTFTAQMKTLADHRRGGEQVIKHVHIDNRGGQAVVAETVSDRGVS